MAIKKINGVNFLNNNGRVFLPSKNIDIFPCSRRGQYSDTSTFAYYDPEARLNTERTNRIGTAINGFTDSFIINETFSDNDTIVFVLAGYRIQVKNFVPADIAEALEVTDGKIYAHLSLHKDISLNVEGYHTEILYRQSTEAKQKNYLDVTYTDNDITDDFFVGISFTAAPVEDTFNNAVLTAHNLSLFEKLNSEWLLVQVSLLPKIKHGDTEDSIKINGDFTVEHTKADGTVQTSFKVTDEATTLGPTVMSSLIVGEVVEGEIFPVSGTIKAKNNIMAPVIVATTAIDTPQLGTAVLTSDDPDNPEIVVDPDKALKVNTIDSDTVEGLTIKQATKLENALEVDGTVLINNTITAEKLVITDKDIDGTDKGEIVTPQLRVNRITSNEGSITVDNKKLIVNKSLEMLAKAPTTTDPDPSPAKATIEQAVIGDLAVKTDTKLKGSTGKISATNSISTDGDLKVGSYINVGSPASPTNFTGNISAKNEITAEARLRVPNTFRAEASDQTTYVQKLSVTENVTAKEVAVEKITQNGNTIPTIKLVQNGTAYQLQFTLDASKK